MKRFYLNTALAATELSRARERLAALRVNDHYAVEERFGRVAITAKDNNLFETLGEAEAALKALKRAAPDLFQQAAVAFVEIGTDELGPAKPPAEQKPLTPLRETKTVVAAEDDPVVLKLIEHALRALDGVDAVMAHSGREALEMIENLEPDLVIIDLMMPDMHGWEVVQQMKANEVLKEIPVVILTALSSEQDRVFALTVAQVDEFLEKPVSIDVLRRRVWAILNR